MLPWSRKMFPGTNLQDLNLDWILRKIAALRGGSTGQYLYKKSNKDFDFGWKTGGGGGGGTSDYLDLDNKPSINNVELTGNKTAADLGLAAASDIPAVPVQSVNGKTGAVELTASDVGAYVKPAAGIPETDLSSSVRTSLSKADTALQAVPPTYRTAAAQDVIDAAQDADIEALAGSIATIESSPATAAHAVGEYIVLNGQLYKVTAAIAAGQTLTVGTNIAATTIAGAFGTVSEASLTVGTNITNIGTFVRKVGKVVVFSGIAKATADLAGNGTTVFTIPIEYAPSIGVTAACYATYNNTAGMYNFFLQTDGVFRTNIGSGIVNANTAIYINFTYFTK